MTGQALYVWKRPCERYYHVWFPSHFSEKTPPPAEGDPDILYQGESYAEAFRIAETTNAKLIPKPAATARQTTAPPPVSASAPIAAAAPATTRTAPQTQLSLFA